MDHGTYQDALANHRINQCLPASKVNHDTVHSPAQANDYIRHAPDMLESLCDDEILTIFQFLMSKQARGSIASLSPPSRHIAGLRTEYLYDERGVSVQSTFITLLV